MRVIHSLTVIGAVCLSACLSAGPAYALEPCEVAPLATSIDKLIDKAVGARPELVLTTENSAWSIYEEVRIVGNTVYFVKLRASPWSDILHVLKNGGEDNYPYHFLTAPSATVYKSPLGRTVANRVKEVYRQAILRSRSPAGAGFDVSTHAFAAAGVGCGATISPEEGSIDGQLVALTDLLANHARITWSCLGRRSESEIVRTLERIEHRLRAGEGLHPSAVRPRRLPDSRPPQAPPRPNQAGIDNASVSFNSSITT